MSAGPTDDLSQLQQCETLLQLGRASEALALLSVLLAHHPENPYVCGLLAQALLATNQPERALELAQRCAALGPESDWPHRLASLAYQRLDKDKDAVAEARTAVRLAPHQWRCHIQLAMVARRSRGTREEAQAAATHALRLAPQEAECHRVAGMVAAAAGRREQALLFFHQALRINPQDAATQNEIGRLSLNGRGPVGGARLGDAATGFAQAVRTDPSQTVSRHNLDMVVRSFLAKLAYFLFLDAAFVSRGLSQSPAASARIMPVLALAIPAGIAFRFFGRLTPQLRDYVMGECRRRPLRFPVLLGIVSSVAVLVGAFAPEAARGGPVAVAAVTAVICRFNLAVRRDQSVQTAKTGTAQPAFSTGLLWCVLVALILFTGMMVFSAFKAPDAALRLLAAGLVPGLLGALVGRAILARHRG